jgi:hypothetical protein
MLCVNEPDQPLTAPARADPPPSTREPLSAIATLPFGIQSVKTAFVCVFIWVKQPNLWCATLTTESPDAALEQPL